MHLLHTCSSFTIRVQIHDLSNTTTPLFLRAALDFEEIYWKNVAFFFEGQNTKQISLRN